MDEAEVILAESGVANLRVFVVLWGEQDEGILWDTCAWCDAELRAEETGFMLMEPPKPSAGVLLARCFCTQSCLGENIDAWASKHDVDNLYTSYYMVGEADPETAFPDVEDIHEH